MKVLPQRKQPLSLGRQGVLPSPTRAPYWKQENDSQAEAQILGRKKGKEGGRGRGRKKGGGRRKSAGWLYSQGNLQLLGTLGFHSSQCNLFWFFLFPIFDFFFFAIGFLCVALGVLKLSQPQTPAYSCLPTAGTKDMHQQQPIFYF